MKTEHPVLREAIEKYSAWALADCETRQTEESVTETLYHYTDGAGLKGILENGSLWFSDYRRLNDPSELQHGIEIAGDVIRFMKTGPDARVGMFLDHVQELLTNPRVIEVSEFFIASLSKRRDDLGQWRAYAADGRGYAIGFSPKLFKIDPSHTPADNFFVSPVVYDIWEAFQRHELAIDEAAGIFHETAIANEELMSDPEVGWPFAVDLAFELLADPLIWNCLTTKHPAFKHEQEIRLVIMGAREALLPRVRTRLRGGEVVPYISQAMPVTEPHSIGEVLVGPAAPAGAEQSVRLLLDTLGISAPVARSEIPYRSF